MAMEVALPSGVAAQAPEGAVQRGKISALNFLVVLAQLALFAIVLRQFQIESGAFLRLALLAFAGFAVHAWLPLRSGCHSSSRSRSRGSSSFSASPTAPGSSASASY